MKKILICSVLVLCCGRMVMAAENATRIVEIAYEDILGRKPDPEGLRNFRSLIIDEDWTEKQVRNALKDSDEYADKIITEAFEDLLGRKPDQGALETYRPKIRKKKWTAKELRKQIRKSPEYKNKN